MATKKSVKKSLGPITKNLQPSTLYRLTQHDVELIHESIDAKITDIQGDVSLGELTEQEGTLQVNELKALASKLKK